MGRITYQDIEKWERERNVKELIKAMKSNDSLINGFAAEALARIGDPSTVGTLLHSVQTEPDLRYVAPKVIVAIGEASGPEHIPLYVSMLSSDIFDVPQAAAKVLDQMGDATVEHLIPVLKSPGLNARQLAAQLLGDRRDKRALEPLIAALDDDDGNMRIITAAALAKLGDPSAIPALQAELDKKRPNDYAERHLKNVIASLEKGEAVPDRRRVEMVKVTLKLAGLIHDSDRYAGSYQAELPIDQAGPQLLNSIAKSIIWKDQVRFYTGYQLVCPQGTIGCKAGSPGTLREAGVQTGDTLEFHDVGGEFM